MAISSVDCNHRLSAVSSHTRRCAICLTIVSSIPFSRRYHCWI